MLSLLAVLSSTLVFSPDHIALFAIAKARSFIAESITSLFNSCLQLAYLPNNWKQILICPLAKIKSPLSPSETRPIVNLCEISKILERIVHHQITHFITQRHILDDLQSGYRSGFSTRSALQRILYDVIRGVDLKEVTNLVIFYFSKAFDTACHYDLLMKLRKLGFSDQVLSWVFFLPYGSQKGCGRC